MVVLMHANNSPLIETSEAMVGGGGGWGPWGGGGGGRGGVFKKKQELTHV